MTFSLREPRFRTLREAKLGGGGGGEESLAQGAKRGRDEEREQRRKKRDGERENGRHAVILREFSLTWVGVRPRVSSVSVGGSETEEVEGQRSRKVRAGRREVSEKESVRARASESGGSSEQSELGTPV